MLFEEEFGRRLRRELDGVEVPAPRPLPARPAGPRFTWIARPLAIGLAATLALAALAASVTHSPDPGRWVQPGVWMRAIGGAPDSPATTPATEPSPSAEPSQSAEPSERPQTQSPEPEPSDRPGPSAEPRESPDPGGAHESPDS